MLIGALATFAAHLAALARLDPYFVITHGSPDVLLVGSLLGFGTELSLVQAAFNRIRHGRWIWGDEVPERV